MYQLQSRRLAIVSSWSRRVAASVALLLGVWYQPAAAGTPPLIEFDVPFAISCKNLSVGDAGNNPAEGWLLQFLEGRSGPSEDRVRANPGTELIEVVIPISARVKAGTERDLKQCLYTLVDPAEPRTLSVTDWLPRTELKTEYAKPILFNKEQQANIGINVAAKYEVTGTAQAGGQVKSGLTYEMLPPQEIVLASGSVQHGHGVFFKLRPTSQTTLEGEKSFSAIFSVPKGWRGGCLKLECEAIGVDRGVVPLLNRETISEPAVFCLALYLAGDGEAYKRAVRMANCQQELFDSFAEHRHEMRAAWFKAFSLPEFGKRPWFLDKSSLADLTQPAPTEETLLNHVLGRATAARSMEDFPAPVREKLRSLQAAAEALQAFSIGAPPAPEKKAAAPVRSVPPTISSNDLLPVPGAAKGPGSETVPVSATVADSKPDSKVGRAIVIIKEPRKSFPAVDVGGQAKASPGEVIVPRGELVATRKQEAAAPTSVSLRPPEVNDSVRPPETGRAGNAEKEPVPAPSRDDDDGRGKLPQDPWKLVCYLIVSMCGAFVACVVAFRLVDFMGRNRQHSRSHRPSDKSPPLTDSVDGSSDLPIWPESGTPDEGRKHLG